MSVEGSRRRPPPKHAHRPHHLAAPRYRLHVFVVQFGHHIMLIALVCISVSEVINAPFHLDTAIEHLFGASGHPPA